MYRHCKVICMTLQTFIKSLTHTGNWRNVTYAWYRRVPTVLYKYSRPGLGKCVLFTEVLCVEPCTAHQGVRYKIFTNDVYHTQPSVMYSRTWVVCTSHSGYFIALLKSDRHGSWLRGVVVSAIAICSKWLWLDSCRRPKFLARCRLCCRSVD